MTASNSRFQATARTVALSTTTPSTLKSTAS